MKWQVQDPEWQQNPPSLWYRGGLEAVGPALSSNLFVLPPGNMIENRLGKFIEEAEVPKGLAGTMVKFNFKHK